MTVLLLAAPFLVTLTLLTSGLAKLGARQGTEDAMTSLRLPLRGTHRTVATALPVAEIVLALLLWIPLVPLQILVAALMLALLVAYLVIIGRALTFEEKVECSCFGTLASPTVSRLTLGRNIVLTALGILTFAAAARGLLATAVAQSPLDLMGLGAALLLTIALTILTLGGTDPATEEAPSHGAADGPLEDLEEDELLDYERDPIPGGVLQRPDGELITLSRLASHRAALLIFVSEGCGPCERVMDSAEKWIEELSPYLQVYFVFAARLEDRRERSIERVGEHALHDLQFTSRKALGAKGAPSAALLGADGMLAGGPVNGGSAVFEFVGDILEQLQEVQPAGDAPAEDEEQTAPTA